MILAEDLCSGCGLCSERCPVEAIQMEDKLPRFNDLCVLCGLCVSLCPVNALSIPQETQKDGLICDHCPVGCQIREGFMGACQRYRNIKGVLKTTQPLIFPPPPNIEEEKRNLVISVPLVTGIGAGTTYPDYVPSPITAQEKRHDIDVVTVVTEAPLTYSSILLKIDTEQPVGKEMAPVRTKGHIVGHVTTEQYGSKMISLGGINLMKTKENVILTRLMVAVANKEPFQLTVEGGTHLELQVGKPPVINGEESKPMKVACGAAIMGMFGPQLKDLADEMIILDSDITGLFSESHVGRLMGFKETGIKPPGRFATPGRYFGTVGNGWGGTPILNPLQALASIDKEKIWPGMKVLILEVTGREAVLLEADEEKVFHVIELPKEAMEMRDLIASNREPSLTSGMYIGGAGGSARSGVTRNPIKLTQAVHHGSVRMSVGGAPTFIFPGGGINFMVDVRKISWRAFTWVPTPAVVAPIEYTMQRETFIQMGGHKQALRLLSDIKASEGSQ